MTLPQLAHLHQQFAPEYQAFLDSGYTDAITRKINESHKLTEPDLVVVRNGFDLYLLFLVTEDELVDFLKEEAEIPVDVSQAIVKAFTADLPSELVSQHQTMYDALHKPGTESAAGSIRTMAGDAAVAQSDSVQATSQDALLQKDDTPNPAV